jgi:hypothetical protein
MQWRVLEDARQDVSGRYEIKLGASELSHCHFTKLQNSTKSGSAFFTKTHSTFRKITIFKSFAKRNNNSDK